MATVVTFEARPGHTISGGSVNVAGATFNIKAALDGGGGQFSTSDPLLIEVLKSVRALRVAGTVEDPAGPVVVRGGLQGTLTDPEPGQALVLGPDGRTAVNGPAGESGLVLPWQADTMYSAGAAVTQGGLTYTRNSDGTSRASFDSTEAAAWTVLPTGGRPQAGGTAFAIPGSAWHNTGIGGAVGGSKNATGFAIMLTIRAGVAANPQQNGHIYLEIAPDNNGGSLPTAGWVTCDYVACRNNQANGTGGGTVQSGGPNIGMGKGLAAIVPKDWWYRLRPFVVPGYAAPSWITDGATPGFFQTFS